MSYVFSPSINYRYSFKKGMSGTDVAALQLNLPQLAVDGSFGNKTEQAVTKWQTDHNLVADGIAGGKTQESLCVVLSTPAARDNGLPTGLLKSIIANESGFYVAAYSNHPSDWGFDLGPYQNSIGPQGDPANQDEYAKSYNVKTMADLTAQRAVASHALFNNAADGPYKQDFAQGNQSRYEWCLTVLNHNWPSAALSIAQTGHVFSPTYENSEQGWIVSASAGRLHTPREWVISYVQRATVYVKWQ